MANLRIEKLSDDIIRKIIAGEIIDGPSSILKELLDNSLDASSSKIVVYVEKNGFEAITIEELGEKLREMTHIVPYGIK